MPYSKKQGYGGFKNSRTHEPWHVDISDAGLERLLEHMDRLASAAEAAADVILAKLGGMDDEEEDTEALTVEDGEN